MAQSLTGIMAVAAASVIDNKGITVNSDLVSEVFRFNSNALIAAVQSKLQSPNTALATSLNLLPNFMTGVAPNITQNLPNLILSDAQNLVVDLKKFAVIFQSADGYINNVDNINQAVNRAQNLKFDDLGFMYQNYNDVLTGGVSNQFKTENLPQLATEFKNLGSLFDISQYTRLDDPSVLIKNLIRQGFGPVANLESKVAEAGVDLDNIEDPDDCDFQPILSSVQGNDLNNIFKNTNFNPYRPEAITDLSKVFDIENLFSPQALESLGSDRSLTDLSRKLGNIGGFFTDSEGLSQFYSTLNLKKFTHLNNLSTVVPAELAQPLQQNLGTGTGPNSSMTILDVLGMISGLGYTEPLRSITDSLTVLTENNTNVQALIAELNKTDYDLVTIETLVTAINADANLQNIINQGNLDFAGCVQRYTIEKNNQTAAKITPAEIPAGTNDDVISFIYSLQRIMQRPNDLGTVKLFENSTTNDVHGESILAVLQEAQNLRAFQTVGINPNTYID